MAEIIDFNEVEIEPHIRTISEEEEEWLMMPLRVRTAQEKTFEQYSHQLPSPATTE